MPSPTKDYYALMGYLQSSRYQQAFIDPPERLAQALRKLKEAQGRARPAAVALTARLLQARVDKLAKAPPLPKARREPQGCIGGLRGLHQTGTLRSWFASGPAFEDGSGPRTGNDPPGRREPSGPSGRRPGYWPTAAGSPTGFPACFVRRPSPSPRSGSAYRVAGRGTRVRLVIDSLELIRDPIYGGLEFPVKHGSQPHWHVQDVSMWTGHRAYIEAVDDGPGFFALEQVVFTDGGAPADAPNPLLARLLDDIGSIRPRRKPASIGSCCWKSSGSGGRASWRRQPIRSIVWPCSTKCCTATCWPSCRV